MSIYTAVIGLILIAGSIYLVYRKWFGWPFIEGVLLGITGVVGGIVFMTIISYFYGWSNLLFYLTGIVIIQSAITYLLWTTFFRERL